jgi:phosphoglycolate phosphatase
LKYYPYRVIYSTLNPDGDFLRKLAVFDLDGTLHHTELALAPAIARAASEITGGVEPPYSLINTLYGEPLEVFCKTLTGKDDSKTCRKFISLVRFHQERTLPELGELYPGVKQMLQNMLDRNFDLAILSNAHMEYIRLVTETLGISHCFVKLAGRTNEASKTKRLAELGIGYDFTVMVGDRYHDIQAAQENSFPAIACLYGYGSAEEHKGAMSVNSALEIPFLADELIREYS